jgi:Domain of unknown function (DUF1918)
MCPARFGAILDKTKGGTMHPKRDAQARAGDVVVVQGHTTGDPGRTGVILDVLDRASGHEHYRVRWDEEHVSLFWPGSDATVRLGSRRERGDVPPPDPSATESENDAVPDSEC